MDVFEYDGQLIELTTMAAVSEEGLIFECWDITPRGGRGLLFTLVEDGSKLRLRGVRDGVEAELITQVLELLSKQA